MKDYGFSNKECVSQFAARGIIRLFGPILGDTKVRRKFSDRG